MKFKTLLLRFTLLLIVSTNVSWTLSAQEKDSIKYSISESKAVVDAYLNLPRYIRLYDSTEIVVTRLESNAVIDSVLLFNSEEINSDRKLLTEKQAVKIEEQRVEIGRQNFWRIFWKNSTIGLAITTGTIIIYEKLKE